MSSGLPTPGCVRRASWLLVAGALVGLGWVTAAVFARQHLETTAPAFVVAVGDPIGGQARALLDTRASLHYDLVVAAASVLLLVALAVLVRRRWRRARVIAWCVIGALIVALALGIAGAPEAELSGTGNEPPQIRRALQDLLFGWYPTAHSLLVLTQVAALVAAAVLLLREGADDYYTSSTVPSTSRRSLFGSDGRL